MINIDIKGLKMKLHYETQELDYARAFLKEIADHADFQNLTINIQTTKEADSQ